MNCVGVEFIALGAWNKAIISEMWLRDTCKNLNPDGVKFSTEIDLGLATIIYKVGEFTIKVSDKVLSIFSTGDTTIKEIEGISKSILDRLPETPLIALGVNFDFVFKKDIVTSTSEFFKNSIFGEFKLNKLQASKQFKEFSMNLIFDDTSDSDKIKIRVNFNYVNQQIQGFSSSFTYIELYNKAKEALSHEYK